MKSVFSFHDYRTYLQHYYLEKKQETKLTYDSFSKQAGIRSPNFLKLVIEGKKNLTTANIHRFAKAMNLNFSEHTYFEALVLHNQSTYPEEKRFYQARVRELKLSKPRSVQKMNIRDVLSKWYYPAVVVLLDGMSEPISSVQIATKIGISSPEVEEAIKALKNAGVVESYDGQLKISAQHLVMTDQKGFSQIHKKFLRDQIGRSLIALEKQYEKRAKFQSQTFTIGKSQFENCINEIYQFLDRLSLHSDESEADDVVQCNVQLFPLTAERSN